MAGITRPCAGRGRHRLGDGTLTRHKTAAGKSPTHGDAAAAPDLHRERAARTEPPVYRIRPAIREDVPRLVRLRELCYMHPLPEVFRWSAAVFESQMQVFPEGQLVVEADGRVVSAATTCLLTLRGKVPGWKSLNLNVWGKITGHKPDGDALYLADLVVHPLYRRQGYASVLCRAVQEFVRRRRLKNLIVTARIPGYHSHAARMSAQDYVRRVVGEKLTDVSLSFWLKLDFIPQAVLPEFQPDADSCRYAVMMEWVPPPSSHSPFSRDRNNDSSMTGSLVDPELDE
jgi:ribosomal protein S18 acetylase RimI-like enzyme